METEQYPIVYRKHTNFDIPIEETFLEGGDFGKSVTFTINRYEDLWTPVYLTVELPRLKVKTLFEICSSKITLDELDQLPEFLKEKCVKNIPYKSSPIPINWDLISDDEDDTIPDIYYGNKIL